MAVSRILEYILRHSEIHWLLFCNEHSEALLACSKSDHCVCVCVCFKYCLYEVFRNKVKLYWIFGGLYHYGVLFLALFVY